MTLKICPGFTNHFVAKNDQFSVEKTSEEGKDAKEEPFWKSEKNIVACHFYDGSFEDLSWISLLPMRSNISKLLIAAHPLRTVTTPPPDNIV